MNVTQSLDSSSLARANQFPFPAHGSGSDALQGVAPSQNKSENIDVVASENEALELCAICSLLKDKVQFFEFTHRKATHHAICEQCLTDYITG